METSTLQVLLLGGITFMFISVLGISITTASALRQMRLLRNEPAPITHTTSITDTQLNEVVKATQTMQVVNKSDTAEFDTLRDKQVKRITQTLQRHEDLLMPERKIG